jgi:hypothetical protein
MPNDSGTRSDAPRAQRIKDHLHGRYADEYAALGVQGIRGSGPQRTALCPFHDDSDPSFGFNNEDGRYLCRVPSCGARGDFLTFVQQRQGISFVEALAFLEERYHLGNGTQPQPAAAEPPAIDEAIVEAFRVALIAHPDRAAFLHERRGLTDETIRQYSIGFDESRRRYIIPVRDELRVVRNIRMYDPDADAKMISWRENYGTARLCPLDAYATDARDPVVICEGELDALLMRQHGFNAVTGTGGAGRWRDEWNQRFARRDVVVCYDADEAGSAGAARVAAALRGVAERVRVVELPPSSGAGTDVTDLIVDHGWDAEQFRAVFDETPVEESDTNDAADEQPVVSYRTLADIDDTPPGELLLGMLEPDGPTLIYGPGGLGKGATSAWAIKNFVSDGMRPLIYDAEGHPREWARRTSGLGVDRCKVVYVQPSELPTNLMGRPMWDVIPHLASIIRAAGCDVLFIDSILASMNLSEEGLKSDAGAPYNYVNALGNLAIPSITIGHTPKNSPEGDPYGSVSWINAMRMTWIGTRAEGDSHGVRWTPRKRNERGHIPAVLLKFAYDTAGRLCGVTREDDETTTRAWITNALANGPRTVDDMAEELAADAEGSFTAATSSAKDRLRQALNRLKRSRLVHKTGGRGAPWALGAAPERR